MRFYQIFAGLLLGGAVIKPANGARTLFDFTSLSNVDDWIESSDVVRTVGMSKAVLALQKTQVFQRAVFFTLLNPQPNGAGFAGVQRPVTWDLRDFDELRLRCRAQGQNENYKIVLRHNGDSKDEIGYEQFFKVPITDDKEFADVSVPLSGFKPYYRGREVPDAQPLDRGQITSFGLQIYGGVYLPVKQAGVSALEIETIIASKSNELPGQ